MLGSKAQHPKVGGVLGSCILTRHPGPSVCSFSQLQGALQVGPVRLCRPGHRSCCESMPGRLLKAAQEPPAC